MGRGVPPPRNSPRVADGEIVKADAEPKASATTTVLNFMVQGEQAKLVRHEVLKMVRHSVSIEAEGTRGLEMKTKLEFE